MKRSMKKRQRFVLILAAAILLLLSISVTLRLTRKKPLDFEPSTAATTQEIPMSRVETTVADREIWPMMLVNAEHALPDDYMPPLMTLANGQQIDARMYPDWNELNRAAKAQGFLLEPAYCYRSYDTQVSIMEDRIAQHRREGASAAEAERMAREYVAEPGHSEHQLGLAVDIHAGANTDAETLFKWLKANAYRFGFVERYPEDKTEITGISFERWHYRYVGKEVAEILQSQGWVLEEYWNNRKAAS